MMSRSILSMMALVCIVGCDAISHTNIEVERRPLDFRDSNQVVADVLLVASSTAKQFGLREVERRKFDMSFTDTIAGENPNIWLTVSHSARPVTLEIDEMYISRRTDRHRDFADALVSNLNTRGLDAVVASQTSDSAGWNWWFVYATLMAVAAVLLLRQFIHRVRRGISK